MNFFILSYGTSTVSSLLTLRLEMAKEYIKDSGRYAVCSLFSFPPDPFPLIVLISAIFTTIIVLGQVFRGNLLGMRQWVLLVGAWSGHHAMMKVQLRGELKKTMKLLSEQLDRTGEQLNRWETLTKKEEGKLEGMQEVSKEINGVAEEFKAIVESFFKIISIQREISQEYVGLACNMEEGREQALKFLREHQEKMKEIEKGLDRRLELIQKHQQIQLRNIELLQKLFVKISESSSLLVKKQEKENAQN